MKITFNPVRVLAWAAAGLLVPAAIWAGVGGPVPTDSTSGTAIPEKLGKNPAAGRVLSLPNGTDLRGAYWTTVETMPSGGTPGQVAGVVASTATRTVVVTGSQTSIATQTYTYVTTATSTATSIATGATGTYTYTATSTSTGIGTSGIADTGTNPRDVCIMGNYAYVAAAGSDRVDIFDISNPLSPSALTPVTVGDDPRGLACESDWVYVTNYAGDSISVIDAATPASAHVESTFSTAAGCNPRAVAVRGNRLYAVCFTGDSFLTIDSTTKTSLSQIGSAFATCDGPIDLTVVDAYYARLTCQPGKRVVTIELSGGGTDVPTQAGYVDNTYELYGIYEKANEFVAAAAYADSKLYLYDTTVFPDLIGSVTTSAGPRHMVIYGSVAILTMFESDKVGVYAIAASGDPTTVEEITVGDGPMDIKVSGDYAWITEYNANKLKSLYIGKYKQFTSTQTTTNTQTATTTVTLTGASTGTQTVTDTSSFTSSATGTTTGTDVEWKPVNGTLYAGSHVRLSKGTSTSLETSVIMSELPTIHANASVVPMASVLPVSDADGLLNSWVSAPVAVENPLLWRYATGTASATATATSVDVVATRPTLTIKPSPVTFACAATNTAITFNGALTLGLGGGIAVLVPNFTPRASTNYLRFSYHITGTSSAGATVTAMIDAVDSEAVTAEWVDGSYLATTVPASGTGFLSSQTIAWHANWTSLRNYRLRLGSTSAFVKPVTSDPGGGTNIATACMYIEELTL